MKITENFLTVNKYSRCGKLRIETLGIVMHWTANPMASAEANRNYFESLKDGKKGIYASAHFIVGLNGEVIQCMPDDEVAYHAGSSKPDPVSGKVYTDLARRLFGKYASASNSPNNCTIGIEMCPTDINGTFRQVTLDSTAELVAELMKKYALDIGQIVTHGEVVGWKDCPRLWTNEPELFHDFVMNVREISL